jgi:Xaa-Pro aminopeptidase
MAAGRILGYISDITRTWAVGGSEAKPDQKHEETYDALYAGFQKGLTYAQAWREDVGNVC